MIFVLFPVLLPFMIWAFFRSILSGRIYEFDPGGHKFMFVSLMVPYRATFWVVFVLSLVGTFVSILDRISNRLGFIFLSASVCALLFNLLVVVFYESYLHAKYGMTSLQSNYGANRYSIILALGTSALFLFLNGLVLLTITMAGY